MKYKTRKRDVLSDTRITETHNPYYTRTSLARFMVEQQKQMYDSVNLDLNNLTESDFETNLEELKSWVSNWDGNTDLDYLKSTYFKWVDKWNRHTHFDAQLIIPLLEDPDKINLKYLDWKWCLFQSIQDNLYKNVRIVFGVNKFKPGMHNRIMKPSMWLMVNWLYYKTELVQTKITSEILRIQDEGYIAEVHQEAFEDENMEPNDKIKWAEIQLNYAKNRHYLVRFKDDLLKVHTEKGLEQWNQIKVIDVDFETDEEPDKYINLDNE